MLLSGTHLEFKGRYQVCQLEHTAEDACNDAVLMAAALIEAESANDPMDWHVSRSASRLYTDCSSAAIGQALCRWDFYIQRHDKRHRPMWRNLFSTGTRFRRIKSIDWINVVRT